MHTTESVLNEIIMVIVMLLLVSSFLFYILTQRLPYNYKTKDYVYLKDILYDAARWIFITWLAITITTIIYHTINSSFPNSSDFENEIDSVLFITILSILIVILNLSAIVMFGRFLKHLFLYFNLKKNNISNNLRHAIATKDENAMIENHKLIEQAGITITLSNDEILVLTACLSKYGDHDTTTRILTPMLRNEHSIITHFLRRNPKIFEYNVKGIDETFKPSNNFKHILKNCEYTFKYIYTVMFLLYFLQLFILFFDISIFSTKEISFVLINSLILIFVYLKYEILHRTYNQEMVKINEPTRKIKIRLPIADNIIMILSMIMLIATFVNFIF